MKVSNGMSHSVLSVFDIVESENLLERAKQIGTVLNKTFLSFEEKYDIIGDVRGIGPMIAMELVKDRHTKAPAAEETKALVTYCYEKGLIILACGAHGNVLRFLMPLVIGDEQLQKGIDIIDQGLSTIAG